MVIARPVGINSLEQCQIIFVASKFVEKIPSNINIKRLLFLERSDLQQ